MNETSQYGTRNRLEGIIFLLPHPFLLVTPKSIDPPDDKHAKSNKPKFTIEQQSKNYNIFRSKA
jgi:hypothetical protein